MDLPTVGDAGTAFTPSMSARKLNTPGFTSFQKSPAGVAASIPDPAIGQTLPISRVTVVGALPPKLSAFTAPVIRCGVQLLSCQAGSLSLRIPKLEPPTISR